MKNPALSMLALLSLVSWAFAGNLARAAETPVDFARDVAPIFQHHCVRCHQPSHKLGELSLATPDDLTTTGYVVAGKPDESYLLEVVTAVSGKSPKMPKEGTALSVEQLQTLRRWIAGGAAWPKGVVVREQPKGDKHWWSLQPIADPKPPRIAAPVVPQPAGAGSAPDWASNPIDRFIAAKLHDKQLAPSPPAAKGELLRRVTYDLTGLPPTPEELAAFLADERHDAFERVVDRLLASPRYGERWGRHWLDVVRFGESRGFERNQIIDNLWPFRDYVIRSFNDDKPFDRFIREQIAGDVIGKDDPEVEVGSAFLTAGPYDDVGNQDAAAMAQIRADTLDEVIRTTSEAFLGLTLGCARCHNHKFDPLLAADYYAMYATFAGVQHGERTVATAAARAGREEKTKPLEAEKQKLADERAKLDAEITARAKQLESASAKLWTRPRVSRYGTEENFAPIEARYVRLTVDSVDEEETKNRQYRIDEFEVWTASDSKAPSSNVALASAGGKAQGASRAIQDFKNAYGAELTIDGKFGERWIAGGRELVIALAKPERIERVFFSSDRTRALNEVNGHTTFPGEYRIETSLDGNHWTHVADSSARLPATKHIAQLRTRKQVMKPDEAERLAQLDARLAKLDVELAAVPALDSWWVGKRQPAPGPFPIFLGGDPQKKGELVTAASLAVFDDSTWKKKLPGYKLDPKLDEAARRIALADWLVAQEHPLTARVLANRVWHYHFGVGIVDTPSDFGFMGSKPTHPELLDFLARRLLADGWRIKPLHRLIVTSQTYRQSSASRAEAARVDGDSRLLWRFPPRRLSAEELRDTMLQVAGKLDLRMGGRGFRLYEYQQDNVATYVPLDEVGPETYRRGPNDLPKNAAMIRQDKYDKRFHRPSTARRRKRMSQPARR
ncbi:MAG: DUF1549 domain-containing protein [Planctomycetia bacterium]|nr:DUF1549 domain-containing protein [Planctomycetia bacterium]